jgi:putative ABC transport system substrate-binding protein
MKRRAFISFAGCSGAAVVWPHIALGQRSSRIAKIGVLWHAGSAEEEGAYFPALIDGFKDLGYVEGRSVTFEHRFAGEQYERFSGQAAELVGLGVDALIASIKPAALAAQRTTDKVPIVFVIVPDPVESKLVASLAKPGANITGLSNMSIELGAKRLQLIKQAVAGLSRIALLVNTNDQETANRFVQDNRNSAAALQLDIVPIEVRTPNDLARAFSTAVERKAHAVVAMIDAMFFNERDRLARLAIAHRLPMMGANLDMVDAGALIAYGPNHANLFRQSARFVDKILKGQKAGDIPVEQPTRFEMRVNLKTAAAIGVNLPAPLLASADRIIQ